jgi:DNA recombination protein RmuC
VGKELYERLGTMGRHVDDVGQALTSAIKAYNRSVGSLESRVLVSARKLTELGVVDGDVDSPRPVDEAPRALSATELIDDAELLDDVELIDDRLVVAPRPDGTRQVSCRQEGGESAW